MDELLNCLYNIDKTIKKYSAMNFLIGEKDFINFIVTSNLKILFWGDC